MVSHAVPMGYESLRTVLLHTDPNLRFKIAQRIPKIRLTEKTVPLKINSLELREFSTTVNGKSYKLGVDRHYPTEDIPRSIKRENYKGGASCDLDQYGFEVPNSSTPILNGDVSFRTENEDDHRNDTEETERGYRLQLRHHENLLAKINREESRGKTEFSKKGVQMMINEYRSKLLPFHCRRNSLSPPYTCYIQLTITQKDAARIQSYLYNHKLYEAAKKLNENLFANRHVIIVNQFKNRCFDILRIPIGFKIFANSVYGYNSQIILISSIVDTSRTLRELTVSITSELVSNFQHSFVKNAENLSINIHTERIDQLVRDLGTLENQHVQIAFYRCVDPNPLDYFKLMRGWLSTERSVGSVIKFGLKTDQIGEEILELVRILNEGTESSYGCVTVLLIVSDATKLQVSYVLFNEECNVSRFLLTGEIMKP